MKSKTPSTSPKPTITAIRQYITALPTTRELPILDERAAQAARSVLGRSNPEWEQRFQEQINTITEEVASSLDEDPEINRYVITETELRGIIARVASRTAGQLAISIGQALTDTEMVPELLGAEVQVDTDSEVGYEHRQLLQGI